MSRARVGLRVGSIAAIFGCVLMSACGRTSIEPCAWDACEEAEGGGPSAGTAGAGGRAGAPNQGGRAGRPSGGTAGTSAGGSGIAGTAPIVGGGGNGGGGVGGVGGNDGGSGGAPVDAPVVLLLLDASTSMYDRQVWAPTYEALTGPGGPFETYQHQVRLGFASYRGVNETSEDDPACADIRSIGFELDNASRIRELYGELGRIPRFPPRETPTGHALKRVTESLRAEASSAGKYILLISDGAPDTCVTPNPQCGQDLAVFAVQQAFLAGIETRAIGIGFGDEYPGCSPETARCGSDHFQDIANAGRGLRVVTPPAGYRDLPCVVDGGGQLLAQYSGRGDAARYYWTNSPAEVADAVTAVLREIVRR